VRRAMTRQPGHRGCTSALRLIRTVHNVMLSPSGWARGIHTTG